uniref:DUF7627 domain-containing protein n=1 Tax=Plectus sambesii TaxID=2011161 RepID=A0A914XL59_9BILA
MVSSNDALSSSRLIELCVTCGRGIDQEDTGEWRSFVDKCVVAYAVQQGHLFIDLAVQISLALIDIEIFQNTMEFVIFQQMSLLMIEAAESDDVTAKMQSFCELMAKLLVVNWPRNYSRCMRERNAVLFAVMNIVKGWLIELKKQMDAPNERMTATCNICAEGLLHLCRVVGRKLWLKWPELVDEMYAVIKPLIVSDDLVAQRSTRLQFLDLYVQINDWPKSGSHGKASR